MTLGIKPNRPETRYGYIQIDEERKDDFYKVKTFTEKPELELAKVFEKAENSIGIPDYSLERQYYSKSIRPFYT